MLLFGATSILGYNLARLYPELIDPYIPAQRRAATSMASTPMCLEDDAWIASTLQETQPDVLIYAHAVCHVANCEANPEWAHAINVGHVERLLGCLPDTVRLVYVSSDHVFGHDGEYDEQDAPCPISVYGRTRVAAEALVATHPNSLIIRHSLPIGDSADGRTGHLDWLRYRAAAGLPMTIVSDEARSAVPVRPLCARVMQLARSQTCGLRHIPAPDCISRPDLAERLLTALTLTAEIDLQPRATRPAPHLGRITLRSRYEPTISDPIESALADRSG